MSSAQAWNCPTVELSNGVQMPILGIGTSQIGGFSQDTVLYALRDCGIRLIDTSKYNGFEVQLAEAIRESGVPRSNLRLTNKLWPLDYGYETAKAAFRESCSRMKVEYLDLYMLHWPASMQPGRSNRELRAESWRALEELYEEGLCRSIGVSNFMIHHLEQLKQDCTVVPHVNQVEYHPFQQPNELIEYCRREGITFQGYCPLAKGQALSNPTIFQVAQKYGRTPAQICIRWSVQNGAITIPKSTKRERVVENCQVFGFQLEEEDMVAINKLHEGRHVSWDPTDVE
ncbi:glyoxal reductase-like [Scophthalmus maximus]|uniref:NADP-dependent oxidoreductase domain-containing protein n=1 Tax=Scophthalmus maximus TaxID=52904 RepID=A0A8D2ZEQ4_SCOMX|nr:glyoxal reductase-like [Scophthalmus maximus]